MAPALDHRTACATAKIGDHFSRDCKPPAQRRPPAFLFSGGHRRRAFGFRLVVAGGTFRRGLARVPLESAGLFQKIPHDKGALRIRLERIHRSGRKREFYAMQ